MIASWTPAALTPASPPVVPSRAEGAPEFRAVYDAYFSFVWRAARRLGVRPAAQDDVVQEVFLVVHRKLDTLTEHASLRSWIYAVVVRTVQQHRRTLQRKSPHERGDFIESSDLSGSASDRPDTRAMANQAKRTLENILDSFDDERRVVFVLHELEGLSAPEIAEITGAKLNTVYSRLRLARAEFEAQVSKAGGER